MHDPRQFCTLKEFLKDTGLSYTTYRLKRQNGEMPPEVKLSRRKILFRREAVEAWAKNKERPPEPQPAS